MHAHDIFKTMNDVFLCKNAQKCIFTCTHLCKNAFLLVHIHAHDIFKTMNDVFFGAFQVISRTFSPVMKTQGKSVGVFPPPRCYMGESFRMYE